MDRPNIVIFAFQPSPCRPGKLELAARRQFRKAKMSIRKKVITAVISSAAIALTAFASVPTASAATGFVGVILPDSVSSPRWETYDHPDLQKAFDR